MATGDKSDILNRLIANTPDWFGDTYPLVTAIFNAFATTGSFLYSQDTYIKLQTRIKTATEDNLDLISTDYFGNELPRRGGETDDQFRQRILSFLLLQRATRPGLFNAIKLLVGSKAPDPILFEPWRPIDCGGYNVASTMGYSIAGKYGSGSYAYQGFADVFVENGAGMANYSGYNDFLGGYGAYGNLASLYYGGESLINFVVSDADIYKLIAATKAEGTIVWTRIHRGSNDPVTSLLYDDDGGILTDDIDEPIYV